MADITADVKVNCSSLLFKILMDMIGKWPIGFVVQLSKLFIVFEVSLYDDQDLSNKKILDVAIS